MKIQRLFLYLAFALFVVSCGKDDVSHPDQDQEQNKGPEEEEEENPTEEPNIGVFKDAVVGGLYYETATQSGYTNEKGEFLYNNEELVTFKVGNIVLGQTEAKALVTPMDLVKTGNSEVTNPEAKNIAAFLQTLDSDADHHNGITILDEVVAAISVSNIDFSAPIEPLLADLVIEVSQKTETELLVVLPEQAAVNMSIALGIDYMVENHTQTELIPFLNTFFSKSPKALIVKHEFDGEGKIITTEVSYRYSGRKIATYEYGEYLNNGLPSSLVRTAIHPLREYAPLRYNFDYDDSFKVENVTIENSRTNTFVNSFSITDRDENDNATKIEYNDMDGMLLYSQLNTYNSFGYLVQREIIPSENLPSGTGIYETFYQYSYDEWGNFNTVKEKETWDSGTIWTRETVFSHRANHTIESTTRTTFFNEDSSPGSITSEEYDAEEFLSFVELHSLSLNEVTTFTYNKGLISETKNYRNGELYFESVYPLNEVTYTRKYFVSEDDYTYYVQHRYQGSNTLIRTEYYDENDVLLRTEYPEDSST